MEKRSLIFVGAFVLISANLAYGPGSNRPLAEVPAEGGVFIEGVVGAAERVNPLFAPLRPVDRDLGQLIFSGLVSLTPGREVKPDLAEKWEVVDGGKAYVFTLRNNVKWHDGEPFSVNDVIFTINWLASEEYTGPLMRIWRGVTAEQVGDHMVKVTLPDRNGLFLVNAAVGILPEHLLKNESPASLLGANAFNLHPIGTGPFRLVGNIGVQEAELVKFNDYYGQQPHLTKLSFKFYDNEETLAQALINGSVTAGGLQVESAIERIGSAPHLNLLEYALPQYRAIYFNQASSRVLGQRSVRQALALATNKQALIKDAVGGLGRSVDSPVLPGFWGHLADIRKYNFDIQAARDLLKKDGWQDVDKDGILEKNNDRLSFSLKFRDEKTTQDIAEALARDWKSIGAEVKVEPAASESFASEVIRPREYQAMIFGQTLGADADPYVYWHSSQSVDPGLNLAVSFDKDIDNSLEAARRELDLGKRIAHYHEFQRTFADLVPAILLYQPVYVYAVDNQVKNLTEDINLSTASDRFANIADWFVRTRVTRIEG